jgi:hypothetical protein
MTAPESARPFVPADFSVPGELVTAQFRLEPLGPQHNDGDYEAWTSSMAHIRATPGFADWSWPKEMTPEENLGDLRRHAEDFAGRTGFTYTVLDPGGRVVGCVYIYPARDEEGVPGGEGSPGSEGAPSGEGVPSGEGALGGVLGEEGAEAAGGTWGVADVRSWVRADRAELDVPLHAAVSAWLAGAWPFAEVRYAPRGGGGGGTA